MKAAIITGPKCSPIYGEFADPAPDGGEVLVKVKAAAISNLVKSRASGQHYSAAGSYPLIPGIDGVGRSEDGSRVYFVFPKAPFGSMAEFVAVPATHCLALPDDLDDVTAAAIANPGMSSWAAFKERAKLNPGETVLINGATGSSGRLAVQIAKHLGAARVVTTGRNPKSLQELTSLGADVTIRLDDDWEGLERLFMQEFRQGIDVVIDYLWGKSAQTLLIAAAKAAPEAVPIRVLQVGTMSGPDITLPGAVLRSSAIELMGSGIGSIPFHRLTAAVSELLQAAGPGKFKIAATPVPLSEVEAAWVKDDSLRRTVFTLD